MDVSTPTCRLSWPIRDGDGAPASVSVGASNRQLGGSIDFTLNIDALIAELLAHPLDQFTRRRNAKVKELRESRDAELARELSAVKKPSVPLWAINQVEKRGLGELRRAAEALSKAQAAAATGSSNAAPGLRAASERIQRQLYDAVGAVTAALRQGGHAVGEETLRRVREILRLAALDGGDTWDRLQNGALASEPRAGDNMLDMFAAGAASIGGQGKRSEARRAAEQAQRAARADTELAERASATAQRLRLEATEAASAARRAADRAAAAEAEADRARAQAQKAQRAARARGVD